MSSSIEKKARALNQYLLESEVVKEFKEYEKRIKEDVKFASLEKELKVLQKKIVRQKSKQDASVTETIKAYEALKKEFNEYPLYVNYVYLKQEVDSLLQEVNIRINGQLANQDLTK